MPWALALAGFGVAVVVFGRRGPGDVVGATGQQSGHSEGVMVAG